MNEIRKRRWLLTVLCFLTFTGSSFALVVYVLSLIDIKLIVFISEIPFYTSEPTNIENTTLLYRITKIILFVLSITGAFYMLKLKIIGFFIYSFAQLLLPSVYFFFLTYQFIYIFTLAIPEYIFSIAFIGLYSLHLNSMSWKKYKLSAEYQKPTFNT